ncbi:MAG: hypothetical protein EBU08_13890, partial [Micrococcales bacterium]|nr:hypothetical protein [Micrococcales bacterium]
QPCFAVRGQVAFVELLIGNSYIDCIYEISYGSLYHGATWIPPCRVVCFFGDSVMFSDSKNQA